MSKQHATSLAYLNSGTNPRRRYHLRVRLDTPQGCDALHPAIRKARYLHPPARQSTGDRLGWTICQYAHFLLSIVFSKNFIMLLRHTATLHATFFASSAEHPPAPKADLIIPVSTLANDTGNDASVPPTFSVCHSSSQQ